MISSHPEVTPRKLVKVNSENKNTKKEEKKNKKLFQRKERNKKGTRSDESTVGGKAQRVRKSTSWSYTRTRSELPVTPVPGPLMPSSVLSGHCMYMEHINSHRHTLSDQILTVDVGMSHLTDDSVEAQGNGVQITRQLETEPMRREGLEEKGEKQVPAQSKRTVAS